MVRVVLVACALACGCGRLDFDTQAAPLTLEYMQPTAFALLGITPISFVPTVTGTPTFTVTPDLPSGVSLDAMTGVVAGTPTVVVDHQSYLVTATAGSESATANLHLTSLPGSAVDIASDAADDDGGTDATCFSTIAGGCSLRAALQTANHRTTGQLVLLQAGTFTIASTLDPITNDVDIVGDGAANTSVEPTAIHPGYGMLTMTTAHALRVEFMTLGNFGMANGAVASVTAGSLEVDFATIKNNVSAGSGGAFYIANGATASLHQCTFTSNISAVGNGWGGVIDGEGAGTAIVVDKCEASKNTAPWGSFSHITTGATLLLKDSTLYANAATIAGTLATPGGVYTLVNDTIAYNTNSAADSAGIYIFSAPASYTVTNTIVAFNTDSTGNDNNCNRRDLTTTMTSNGSNLFSDGAGNCAAYFTAPGDQLSIDPGLDPAGPLNHGGPNRTFLLVTGSPAIDSGQNASCPVLDQRSLPRPVARTAATPTCDIGALEMQPTD